MDNRYRVALREVGSDYVCADETSTARHHDCHRRGPHLLPR